MAWWNECNENKPSIITGNNISQSDKHKTEWKKKDIQKSKFATINLYKVLKEATKLIYGIRSQDNSCSLGE